MIIVAIILALVAFWIARMFFPMIISAIVAVVVFIVAVLFWDSVDESGSSDEGSSSSAQKNSCTTRNLTNYATKAPDSLANKDEYSIKDLEILVSRMEKDIFLDGKESRLPERIDVDFFMISVTYPRGETKNLHYENYGVKKLSYYSEWETLDGFRSEPKPKYLPEMAEIINKRAAGAYRIMPKMEFSESKVADTTMFTTRIKNVIMELST